MVAAVWDLIVDQGADWQFTAIYCDANQIPIAIPGWSAAMMIKESYLSQNNYISLNSSGGGITVTGATGNVFIEMTAAQTLILPPNIVCYYDLMLYDTSTPVKPYRLMQGKITVRPGITL